MKIVIYVNYSNIHFNKDFELSNLLISNGHNVFLAVNDIQFEELKKNCDRSVLGYSFDKDIGDWENLLLIKNDFDLADSINMICN